MASCVCDTGVWCQQCYSKEYYIANKEARQVYAREYRERNKYSILYKERRAKTRAERNKERLASDVMYKLKNVVRKRLQYAFYEKGLLKPSATNNMLGCSYDTLLEHLFNSALTNYGFYLYDENYHIDHIIPSRSATNELDLERLNHYTNLQWLTAVDNLKKGGRV